MFVKIVCTIGPSSENYGTLMSMAKAGMNVARLNFSHGDYEGHERKLNLVRRVERDAGAPSPPSWTRRAPRSARGRWRTGRSR